MLETLCSCDEVRAPICVAVSEAIVPVVMPEICPAESLVTSSACRRPVERPAIWDAVRPLTCEVENEAICVAEKLPSVAVDKLASWAAERAATWSALKPWIWVCERVPISAAESTDICCVDRFDTCVLDKDAKVAACMDATWRVVRSEIDSTLIAGPARAASWFALST